MTPGSSEGLQLPPLRWVPGCLAPGGKQGSPDSGRMGLDTHRLLLDGVLLMIGVSMDFQLQETVINFLGFFPVSTRAHALVTSAIRAFLRQGHILRKPVKTRTRSLFSKKERYFFS